MKVRTTCRRCSHMRSLVQALAAYSRGPDGRLCVADRVARTRNSLSGPSVSTCCAQSMLVSPAAAASTGVVKRTPEPRGASTANPCPRSCPGPRRRPAGCVAWSLHVWDFASCPVHTSYLDLEVFNCCSALPLSRSPSRYSLRRGLHSVLYACSSMAIQHPA